MVPEPTKPGNNPEGTDHDPAHASWRRQRWWLAFGFAAQSAERGPSVGDRLPDGPAVSASSSRGYAATACLSGPAHRPSTMSCSTARPISRRLGSLRPVRDASTAPDRRASAGVAGRARPGSSASAITTAPSRGESGRLAPRVAFSARGKRKRPGPRSPRHSRSE